MLTQCDFTTNVLLVGSFLSRIAQPMAQRPRSENTSNLPERSVEIVMGIVMYELVVWYPIVMYGNCDV